MLNDEQKEQLNNSMWVINTVMKEQGLQGNKDMYSLAGLFLCKCIQKYDPTKGVKWTTYAYKSLTLYIKRENAKELIKQARCVSDQKLFYIAEERDYEEEMYYKFLVEKLKTYLNDRELMLLELKLQDKSGKDICEIMNLSHERVRQIWCDIKDKARTYLLKDM